MDYSLKKVLMSYQKPNESLSTYYILSTVLLGFSSIILSVASFNTLPWVTFLMYPFIFIFLCRSVVLLHDAGHNLVLEAAAAFAPANSTSQAKSQDRKRAAAAQQLQALGAVAAPQLQRCELKRALWQREVELHRRLQIMRAQAAGTKDGARGCGGKHKSYIVGH